MGSEPLSPSALRGGPGLHEDGWHNSFVWMDTDRRKPIALGFWAAVGGNFGTDGSWYEFEPELSFRPTPLLNGSLGVEYRWRRNPVQWVGALSADDSTYYVLAELEQKTLELVLRFDWSFTPNLSLQFYGQPFVSAGSYSEFKEVTRPRAREFADRFRFYGEELSCGEDLTCEVDLDLDGTADLSFDDPDFNSRQLRSTLVLRWEYRPGSVLFFAWQHGRDDYLRESRFGGLNDLTDLFGRRPDNTFLFKANYWVAF